MVGTVAAKVAAPAAAPVAAREASPAPVAALLGRSAVCVFYLIVISRQKIPNKSANRSTAHRPPTAIATTSKASSAVTKQSIPTATTPTSTNVTARLAAHAITATGTLVRRVASFRAEGGTHYWLLV